MPRLPRPKLVARSVVPRHVKLVDTPPALFREASDTEVRVKPIFQPFHRDTHVVHSFNWGFHRQAQPYRRARRITNLPLNYTESPLWNVRWDSLNEAWEVFWYENNKLNARPFAVRSSGSPCAAKARAIRFAEDLQALHRGRHLLRPQRKSASLNVHYDEILQCWGTIAMCNGRPRAHYFSAGTYGYEGAKQVALRVRTAIAQSRSREAEWIRSKFVPH